MPRWLKAAAAALVIATTAVGVGAATGGTPASAETTLVCVAATDTTDHEVITGTNTWKVVRYVMASGETVDRSINATVATQADIYIAARAAQVQYCRPGVTSW